MGDSLRRGVRIRAFTLLSAALVVVFFFVLFTLEQRRRALEAERQELLFDATISASMIGADLRVAQTTVESMLSGREGAHGARDLAAVALRISGATNVYLLDDGGEVLASAFRRGVPSLSAPGGMSRLIDQRIGVAEAAAEGGFVLALVSRVSSDRRVAVLFRRFVTQGYFATLLAGRGGLMTIVDAGGASVRVDGSSFEAPLSRHDVDWLEASFALPSFPLTVSVGMEKGAALSEWRVGLQRGSAVVALFIVLVAALLSYGNRLKYRGFESKRLASELALKELLFKESNHRIKNNLSIVQGILRLSASDAEDGEGEADILKAAASRVESIALLHDNLSHRDIGETVMLDDYLGRLVEAIVAASRAGCRVKVATDFQAGLAVDMEAALHCALIVNELITNALKYAFPGDREGSVSVTARRGSGDEIIVGVEDDGAGYEASKEGRSGPGGLGTQIVGLLAQDLGAKVERGAASRGGCSWSLTFSRPPSR